MPSRRTGVASPPVVLPATARRALEGAARSVVDYGLARRATLHGLRAGRLDPDEVCDAQVYLLRAARYHGEATGGTCPVCRRPDLVEVTYTYGECFRAETNGRARAGREILEIAATAGEFTAYLVEVCPSCRWNHLLVSYVLGTGAAPRRRARS